MSTEVGSSPHPRLVLAATTLANAMVLVDQTAVPLTLPAIMRHYDVGSQSVQWLLNGSLVSLAALLVFGGHLTSVLPARVRGRGTLHRFGLAVDWGGLANL